MHEKIKYSDAIECKWTQRIGSLFPEEPIEVKALERSVKKESEMQDAPIVLTSFHLLFRVGLLPVFFQ